MIVQGVDLAESLEEIKLPADATPVIREGALLPEVLLDGTAYLVGVDGQLHPRTVNNERHAAIGASPAPPAKKKRSKKKN